MRSPLPAVATVLLSMAPAQAHVADEIVVSLDPISGLETITLTGDTLALLAPIDANGDGELTQADLDSRVDALRLGVWEQAPLADCVRGGERATLEQGVVVLRAQFRCPPGELTQEFRWLMVLPANYRVLFGSQIAKGDARTVHLGSARPPAAAVALERPMLFAVVMVLSILVLGIWLVRRRRP